MRIAVIGAGGVGGYFGGRLAAAGTEVTFVARGAQLDAIRTNGLKILSPLGDSHIQPARAVESIDQAGAVDLVLIAVKLSDTESVAQTLRPLSEKGAAILSLQNGVEKDAVLRKYLAADSIIGGVCYIGAKISKPGVISHTGSIQRMVFGEYTAKPSKRTEALLDACKRAAIDAEISGSIERLIWEKFVFLVGLSGTTSTIRQPIGPIRENPRSRAFLLDVMQEVVALGRALGVGLSEDYAQDRLAFCDSLPPSMTSSMYNDLENGNRLELPWLSGGVAAMGRMAGTPTPMNRAISDILALYSSGKI
jgi:2-dehydropantoate 2-reductase